MFGVVGFSFLTAKKRELTFTCLENLKREKEKRDG